MPVIEDGDVFKLTIRHESLNIYEISLVSYLKERPGANRADIENTLDISLASLRRAFNSQPNNPFIISSST